MAGCQNCGAKAGCDHRKGDMLGAVTAALERVYPTRRWGQTDDAARFGTGVSEHETQQMSEWLAHELEAATVFVEGDAHEMCDYIYVLCVGREPCLAQIRDGGVAVPDELRAGDRIEEQYLRVCVSHVARMAAMQQVAMVADIEDDALAIVEVPRPGVYDAPLLHRMRSLVSSIAEHDILHVDFGEISAPPMGFDAGAYDRMYGGEPHTVNYLFFPQPSTSRRHTLMPRR